MADALIDSNVVVAAVARMHSHHEPSIALFSQRAKGFYAVAAHSLVEVYSTLTRRGPRAPLAWPPDEALAAIESVAAVTALVGLTPGRSLEAIRDYADTGGIGPRVYDRLIGETARAHGLGRIVT